MDPDAFTPPVIRVKLQPEDRGEWISLYSITATLVLDPVDDVDSLRSSLYDLLRTKGWSKLAAQLRYNEDGDLEHIFTDRTADTPVTFTHAGHDLPLDTHPLGAQLPSATEIPSFHSNLGSLSPLFQHPGCCKHLSELLARGDHPPISAHVSSFTDATLIGLTVPHVLADMATVALILRAWLNRRPADPVFEVGKSPLDVAAGTLQDDGRPVGSLRPARGWYKFLVTLTHLFDLLWRGFVEEERMVFLPPAVVARLRREADLELDPAKGEWVSQHDLVASWTLKMLNPDVKPSDTHPFTLLTLVDARRWARDLFKDITFIGNAASNRATRFPSNNLRTLSIARLALKVRGALQDCTTDDIVQSTCMTRTYMGRKDGSTSLSDPAPRITLTSWCAANLGTVTESTRWGGAFLDGEPKVFLPKRYTITIVGKSKEGGYWISSAKTPAEWLQIDRHFALVETDLAD